jgi:coniferyl-aldehyde dehydrogenase
MSVIPNVERERESAPAGGELRRAFDVQRAAFARGAPDYRRRMDALAALRDGLHAHQEALTEAVSADFGGRSRDETLALEIFPLLDQIRHARRHLRSWMKRRHVRSAWFLRPSDNYIVYQPLGVVGVIGAWNYQLLLTLGPVVDAIAAGNHVMLKPSEITPRSADVIAAIVAERYPPEYVTTITGGPEVASEFSSLPFDHLFFTGSTRVGSLVMRAAADNLTPVTLELGGKSPAIVHDDFPMDTALRRILTGKLYNAGQTCVAPDYLLVPAGRLGEVEHRVPEIVKELYPRLVDNADYTRIVSRRHYERLANAAGEASRRGARVIPIDPAGESFSIENRVYPPTLVFDAPDDTTLMREEIFGPILPVVAYRTLDEAIAYVNARPRPLALYYFDPATSRADRVVDETVSGGVLINDVVLHLGQPNLPFGGVGPSGMGHYHGLAGFRTFSKEKGVMVQSRFAVTGMFRPPYGVRFRFLLDKLLRIAMR